MYHEGKIFDGRDTTVQLPLMLVIALGSVEGHDRCEYDYSYSRQAFFSRGDHLCMTYTRFVNGAVCDLP